MENEVNVTLNFHNQSEAEAKTETETENSKKNMSEKFIYHFDYPHLTESGYVEIQKHKIIVLFPDKKNFNVPNGVKYNQNISVYLNNEQRFSYEWLPIYSPADFYKVKDMLQKAYYEFKILSNLPLQNETYYPMFSNEVFTEQHSEHFYLTCFETMNSTSIEINTFKISKMLKYLKKKNEKFLDSNNQHVNVQIYIGSNLIFCSIQDLLFFDLPINDVNLIIERLLYKLIKY
jgi:hypothetical protein